MWLEKYLRRGDRLAPPAPETEPAGRAPAWSARRWWIMLGLVLLNGGVGLHWMNEGLFHYDAVDVAQAVERTYATGELQGSVHGRYGAVLLGALVYFPFHASGQDADLAIRSAGVLFHALSIAALFAFVVALLGVTRVAAIAALLYSFVPLYFCPNTYGKEHGAALFLALAGLALLLEGMARRSRGMLVAAGLACAGAPGVREAMLALVPWFGLAAALPPSGAEPFRARLRARLGEAPLALAFALPFGAALGLVLFAYLGRVVARVLLEEGTDLVQFLGPFSPVLRLTLRDLWLSLPWLLWPCAAWGLVAFARARGRHDPLHLVFLLSWLGLVLYFGNSSAYRARYLDAALVPLFVFAACGVDALWSRSRVLGAGLLVGLVAWTFALAYPLVEYRRGYNGAKRFAQLVGARTEPGARIVVMDDAPFIAYYGRRATLGHPIGDPTATDVWVRELEASVRAGTPHYLVPSGLSYDPGRHVERALRDRFHWVRVASAETEDYHGADIRFTRYEGVLHRLEPK